MDSDLNLFYSELCFEFQRRIGNIVQFQNSNIQLITLIKSFIKLRKQIELVYTNRRPKFQQNQMREGIKGRINQKSRASN
ncbi:unnamed protein product [Paramecium sonneborni]|uniref:Uncharacterized protein n=1 Tax=Paramecium sonneborni TaxID=65129 RepID=A0A8S1PTB1_9CILI|nr:unnamed protein product [Paramecium sonneborni]